MVHLNKENYGSSMKKNFQTAAAIGLVCETKKRRTSTEAIDLCLSGKDWIILENATAPFSTCMSTKYKAQPQFQSRCSRSDCHSNMVNVVVRKTHATATFKAFVTTTNSEFAASLNMQTQQFHTVTTANATT